jgi:hypothetical protein
MAACYRDTQTRAISRITPVARLTDLRFTRTNRDALKYTLAMGSAAVRVGCNRELV